MNLRGLGTVFGAGEEFAALAIMFPKEVGTVFVVSVVRVALVRWPCKWLALGMAFVSVLALSSLGLGGGRAAVVFGGKFCLGLGGGRPAVFLGSAPGEYMAA